MNRDDVDTIQLKVRMRERLRARVEESASTNGHSLSSEIVSRLERSFYEEDLLARIFGSPERARRSIALNATMSEVDTEVGRVDPNDGDAVRRKHLIEIASLAKIIEAYMKDVLAGGGFDEFALGEIDTRAIIISRRAMLKGDRNLYRETYPGDIQDHDPRADEFAARNDPKRKKRGGGPSKAKP